MPRTIAVLGTLDTKGEEAQWLREVIEARGYRAIVIDASIAYPLSIVADVPREQVAAAAGAKIPDLVVPLNRDKSMETMATGAGNILKGLYESGQLDGVLGIGGGQGTFLVARAMQVLPIGVPKVIASATASTNIRPLIRCKDIAILFSVADILGGPNSVTKVTLGNAAGAVIGMVEVGSGRVTPGSRPAVGVTAFGTVNTAVITAVASLKEMGCEPIAFHGSGACGSAMEELIDEGVFSGVLDLVTHDVIGELFPKETFGAVNPGRLEAAGRKGIPQVIAPAGLNHFVFGPVDTIPAEYRDRTVYAHNPSITAVKLTPDEMRAVAQLVARKLNAARGPVTVMVPLHGWSDLDKPGAVLHNPEGDEAFLVELKVGLDPRIPLRELPLHMNDKAFALEAVAQLKAHLGVGAAARS